MMKIINAWWQSMLGSSACSGIIVAENNMGKRHVYVGALENTSDSEENDAKYICERGQKYEINSLIKFLEENKSDKLD